MKNAECHKNYRKDFLYSTHYLDPNIEIVKDRKEFVVEYCRGKNVIHIGCVGSGSIEDKLRTKSHLHLRLSEAANKLIGIDINNEGIDSLHKAGFNHCYTLDIENERIDEILIKEIDVIVIPEVMEHLSNPGSFLDKLKDINFWGDILVSVPNAFSYRVLKLLKSSSIEFVHADHKYYFSPTTLTTLFTKHGFTTIRQCLYYWPSDDTFGNEFEEVLRLFPYLAEGIVNIARDFRHTRRNKTIRIETVKTGEIFFQERNYARAELFFLELLKSDPQNVEAYNNLGVIAYSCNDTVKAVEYFTIALEIDPFYKDAIFNLGYLVKTLNTLHEAVPFLEKAVEKYPNDNELKNLLIEAKYSVPV